MGIIYKYPLEITDEQILEVPMRTTFLTVMFQNGQLYVWGKHSIYDPPLQKVKRRIVIVGTGHEFDNASLNYIGTVQERGFVWHVFNDYSYQLELK